MKDLKFEKPRTSVEEIADQGKYGKFVISPLERGFGITLGNALRRTLLSSLPGAAFVNVKIDGVQHEFQNIDGVVEDVITIILNLKRVVLSVDSEDPNFETIVEINKGEGEVTAADIIHSNEVVVVKDFAQVLEGEEYTVEYLGNKVLQESKNSAELFKLKY